MITFIFAILILIIGYIFYSRLTEKIFSPDSRLTPALANPDGVDTVPISKVKAFLIELLNIAGTGPIFGAISGALFGPIVFIWIVFGCILGGAVHDYFTGMISSRNGGNSIVFLAGKYISQAIKVLLLVFSLVLLILVTAVFVVSPAGLLQKLTDGNVSAVIFMFIILAYYLLATILPIDKIIGKAYPFFGLILSIMAIAVFIGFIINQDEYPILEMIGNFRDFSIENGGLPWWPFMFTTVACGAVSGFHATQSPLVAKCIKSEKDGRQVFYAAMIAEGIIALIWAAAAMAFYKVDTPDGFSALKGLGGGNSNTVYEICATILGPAGSVLAIIGVVICPITSGDTALRGARLILSELFKLPQEKIGNRLSLSIPLIIGIALISAWNFLDPNNFNLLWSWFAWSNQLLASFALLVCTAYLLKKGKYKFGSLITAIPMSFMFTVVTTYLFAEPNISFGRYIPQIVSLIIGICLGVGSFIAYLVFLIIKLNKENKKSKTKLNLTSN